MEVPSSTVANTVIWCACCGTQKLAEIKDGKLIIYDRRHGVRHFAVVSLIELMEKNENTISPPNLSV